MEFVDITRLKATLQQGELPAVETAKYLAGHGAIGWVVVWRVFFVMSSTLVVAAGVSFAMSGHINWLEDPQFADEVAFAGS